MDGYVEDVVNVRGQRIPYNPYALYPAGSIYNSIRSKQVELHALIEAHEQNIYLERPKNRRNYVREHIVRQIQCLQYDAKTQRFLPCGENEMLDKLMQKIRDKRKQQPKNARSTPPRRKPRPSRKVVAAKKVAAASSEQVAPKNRKAKDGAAPKKRKVADSHVSAKSPVASKKQRWCGAETARAQQSTVPESPSSLPELAAIHPFHADDWTTISSSDYDALVIGVSHDDHSSIHLRPPSRLEPTTSWSKRGQNHPSSPSSDDNVVLTQETLEKIQSAIHEQELENTALKASNAILRRTWHHLVEDLQPYRTKTSVIPKRPWF